LPRAATFAIFVTIACAIVGGVHFYFWARLVRDTQLAGWARTAGTVLFTTLATLVVSSVMLRRLWPGIGRVLAWPGFIWIGAMFILLVILLSVDLLHVVGVLTSKVSGWTFPSQVFRLASTRRILAGAALLGTTAVTAAAVYATHTDVKVKHLEITLDRLPRSLDGTKLVMMSDLHLGGLLGRDFAEKVTATANQLDADAIVIVGDLVDDSIERLRPTLAPLTGLRARHGVFFVTGNHEYYTPSPTLAWLAEIERMGIHVLHNRHVTIESEKGSFDLAGVADHSASRFPDEGPGEDVGRALAGRDPSHVVVLLAHQPKTIFEASKHGVDLQLSGHTHGGQIQPWGALVRLQQPFVRGLHRLGNTQIYVSNGTGFWGPPMRLFAPAEIAEITLRASGRSP
jgi:predicted MPP superfamily phosphohydrolase